MVDPWDIYGISTKYTIYVTLSNGVFYGWCNWNDCDLQRLRRISGSCAAICLWEL